MENNPTTGRVIAVCIGKDKSTKKENINRGKIIKGFGLEGDAHAGNWHRQISLLSIESIQKMRDKGLDVGPGNFAENITTQGIDLLKLPIGTKLTIGKHALLEVTQIGKVCHTRCTIFYQAGDCVMPKEGIFARVLRDGIIEIEDEIEVVK
ncbi:MAG: MOSC domain-containing protein [Deltaproteobacteria bacterium]|jgi:MOSC domain-containing protein YiiM|nr:MAG: MOSC domain-containing protein [Deltaproteobacteria bacterium]